MQELIHVAQSRRADIRFQDGALPHLKGVKSHQVLRCNRSHPEMADGLGWTYNHAPALAWAYGYFFLEYLSNPVDEHQTPGHTLLVKSHDGIHWDKPVVAFPEVAVPTWQYRGPRSDMLQDPHWTCPHQRMGFFLASNGVLLLLSFYGLVHDRRMSAPCDGWGVGRAVRQVRPDGTLAEDIYFLLYNEPAGYTAENTGVFAPFRVSGDAAFVAACEELLQNGAAMRQMYEEQRFDRERFPGRAGEALSFYTVDEGEMLGMYKKGLVSVSRDQGRTWSDAERQSTICTSTGKVWGQRTSDGRFTLMYNPSPDGQHRWPIAAVVGADGHHFGSMAAITGDMSPQRYGGRDKNLGPQYMRGIAECNQQTPDGDVWLTYANNKEDIWISRIPVPLTAEGASAGTLRCQPGVLPADWSVYAPLWAPVEAERDALVLHDRDPYDQARVEMLFAPAKSGLIRFTLTVMALSPAGSITFEVQDDAGRTPIRLVIRPDGMLCIRHGGRTDPWRPVPMGKPVDVEIAFDLVSARYTVKAQDGEKSGDVSEAAEHLTRFRLMTKEQIPRLSTLDCCGKWGTREQLLPGADDPTDETIVRLSRTEWSVNP